MEVLLKIGSYAGQVRDVKPIYARQMIERGEAVDPNLPVEVAGELPAHPVLALQSEERESRKPRRKL